VIGDERGSPPLYPGGGWRQERTDWDNFLPQRLDVEAQFGRSIAPRRSARHAHACGLSVITASPGTQLTSSVTRGLRRQRSQVGDAAAQANADGIGHGSRDGEVARHTHQRHRRGERALRTGSRRGADTATRRQTPGTPKELSGRLLICESL